MQFRILRLREVGPGLNQRRDPAGQSHERRRPEESPSHGHGEPPAQRQEKHTESDRHDGDGHPRRSGLQEGRQHRHGPSCSCSRSTRDQKEGQRCGDTDSWRGDHHPEHVPPGRRIPYPGLDPPLTYRDPANSLVVVSVPPVARRHAGHSKGRAIRVGDRRAGPARHQEPHSAAHRTREDCQAAGDDAEDAPGGGNDAAEQFVEEDRSGCPQPGCESRHNQEYERSRESLGE